MNRKIETNISHFVWEENDNERYEIENGHVVDDQGEYYQLFPDFDESGNLTFVAAGEVYMELTPIYN